MNDLLSATLSGSGSPEASPNHHVIQMTEASSTGAAENLDKFFKDVESINDELKELVRLNRDLSSSHEHSKMLYEPRAVKDLRAKMESDVNMALKKARLIKVRLEALHRSNNASFRVMPGCEPGSDSERARTSVVNGLRKKLKDSMEKFNKLREKISSEYRETVERRYFIVTGENPDEQTLDHLISTGGSEIFMQKAIEEQGRGRILDTINEIQERHDTVKDLEKNLMELHQMFMDMEVVFQTQDENLGIIESNVHKTSVDARESLGKYQKVRSYQKGGRKLTCLSVFILLLIVLLGVLFLIRSK